MKFKINGIMNDKDILWKKLKCKCDKSDIEKTFPLTECIHCKCEAQENSMPRKSFKINEVKKLLDEKKIKNGLTIAIEPMINLGTEKIDQLSDNWTIVTSDGKPSAHFEHDVAVVDGKPVKLSTIDYIYEALGIK